MAGRVVVVLGGCGNIGSAVVKVLLENCKLISFLSLLLPFNLPPLRRRR